MHIFTALRSTLTQSYGIQSFRKDVLAGVSVAFVAIPLAMALAIATGVAPQQGLYTVIIAGFVVGLLGGSRFQVTGPTSAFVVLLTPVVAKYGVAGLCTAGFLAGILLIGMSLTGLASIIQYVPHPVTTGFTCAIAVVIGGLQLKDFFGLTLLHSPETFLERISLLASAANTFQVQETLVGLGTLVVIFLCQRFKVAIPSPLLAVVLMTLIVWVISQVFPEFHPKTIASEFTRKVGSISYNGIPNLLPTLDWPWRQTTDGRAFTLSWEILRALLPTSMAIAMLGAIESLLTASAADGLTHTNHDPHAELMGLGVGNLLVPFFGGIPAVGALARTAANIRFGAVSPVATMIHAVATLLVVSLFAPIVSMVPMATLAGLLLFVAFQMFERKHFFSLIQQGRSDDKTILLTCFGLTVLFDMVIGVGVGMVLACFIIIRRFADLTQIQVVASEGSQSLNIPLPAGTLYYKIQGPLFFGASQRAMSGLRQVQTNITAIVFDLSAVPLIDITGLVAFESALTDVINDNRRVVIVTSSEQVRRKLKKFCIHGIGQEKISLVSSLSEAAAVVTKHHSTTKT